MLVVVIDFNNIKEKNAFKNIILIETMCIFR